MLLKFQYITKAITIELKGGQQGETTDDKAKIARDQRHEQRGQQRQSKNAGQRRKGRAWNGRRGRQQRQTEYVGEG